MTSENIALNYEPLPVLIEPAKEPPRRIMSIDALRGFVMFTMIFVNDFAGVDWKNIKPPYWMRHFTDNGRGWNNGMTFVDVVFPAFLFIVGMSIPFALGSRLKKGEPIWKILLHVLSRTAALLLIGIMMVNGEGGPDSKAMGWSRTWWEFLMFLSAIFAFSTFTRGPRNEFRKGVWKIVDWIFVYLRAIGFAGLIVLAFAYTNRRGAQIISHQPFNVSGGWYCLAGLIAAAIFLGSIVYLIFNARPKVLLIGWGIVAGLALTAAISLMFRTEVFKHFAWPFSHFAIRTEWYGILGLIGWAYLVGSLVYLVFRSNRTALLGCMVLLFCLYPADQKGMTGFRPDDWLFNLGHTLPSQTVIFCIGLLITLMLLVTSGIQSKNARMRLGLWVLMAIALGFDMLHRYKGIDGRGSAISWLLWIIAVGSALVLLFYFIDYRGAVIGLIGGIGLLLCLYPATRTATFSQFHIDDIVEMGGTLGSQAAIAVGGILLVSILLSSDATTPWPRTKFTLWFIAGCAAAALLTARLYGINKNEATPSWCLWSCAITAAVWLIFYFVCDVLPLRWVGWPWAIAGQNVLLAYLLSEMTESILNITKLDDWYGHFGEIDLKWAIGRSLACAALTLLFTSIVNFLGFRLKL